MHWSKHWQNITGATSASFTPPKIAGTRLYRVVVTASDCNPGTSGMTVTSNCARVTVNVMNGTASGVPGGFPAPHGTGDNPPPLQFANCGGLVLPSSSHIIGTLQPPAIGAVNGITSYTWSATGGSFTGSGASVTWIAPTATGLYSITVTYGTSCGTFQSSCNVEVGSPNCDYAYVRPAANGGVDAVDKGGPDNPYATLAYAISQLGGRRHIRLANGNYTFTSRVNIPSNVIIEGRYDAANGWRKQNNGSTNITFTNAAGNISTSGNSRHLIGVAANGTSGWTLQDINVTTASVTGTHTSRGSSNYALWLNGASNYNIIRCQFTAGAASAGAAGLSPAASTLRNNGSNGVAGHCDNNNSNVFGGAAGGAVGTGVRTGGAGGAGGRGSAHNSSNNAVGSNGSNGGGGAAGGTCGGARGANGGCGTNCNRDGRAGCNGTAGTAGANASTVPPAANNTYGAFWTPNGQSSNGSDGHGGGGGKGGGGGGRQNGTFCDNGPGSGGGGGGSGGQGGQAGTGGWGGGGSFAFYRNNSSTGANIVNIITSIPGTVASGGAGGIGANGAPGGIGACGDGSRCNNSTTAGNSISGSRVCSNCEVGAGGRGGSGGAGGKGGNGQPGATGRNEHMVTVVSGTPTITNPSTTIPVSPVIRVLLDKGKPCINSEINLYKASGTWAIPTGLTFVNDRNETAGGTSYTTATQNIKVYTSTMNATYNLTAPADFPGFLRIAADNRPLPAITIVPNSLCVGAGAAIQLTHTNPWNTQVDYDWVIFSATGNDANTALLTSTQNNPLVDVSSLPAGSYKVRYRVREICCGWSRPVYANFTITPQPTQPNNLTKTTASNQAQACEGATGLSVNAATGGTGGAGTCVYEYSYQNTDASWSNWQTAIPSITAGDAPGFVRIKARRNCNGVACNESPETPFVEWEIVDQPTAGAVSRGNPVEQLVCVGVSLTPAVSGGNGGVAPTDQIQWRKGTSGAWTTYTVPVSTTTHGAGDYYFQTRRTSSGLGCTSTAWEPAGNGALLWLVNTVPIAPTITKNPVDASTCIGSVLTVNVTAFGSGGPAGCEDQMRFSTNNGASWSAWGTAVPSVTTSATGTVLMQSRRNCDGTVGCTSNVNQVSWTVVADPTVSTQPTGTTLCAGQSHTLTTAIAGGAGLGYQWQYWNGSIWTPVTANQPATGFSYSNANTAALTVNTSTATPYGTNYQFRCVVTSGNGCDPNPLTTSGVTISVIPAVIETGFRTWTGMAADSNWDNPFNWDCGGVPTSVTNVVIPATSPPSGTFPIIVNGQTANCNSIRVVGSVTRITIQDGGFLNIHCPAIPPATCP